MKPSLIKPPYICLPVRRCIFDIQIKYPASKRIARKTKIGKLPDNMIKLFNPHLKHRLCLGIEQHLFPFKISLYR